MPTMPVRWQRPASEKVTRRLPRRRPWHRSRPPTRAGPGRSPRGRSRPGRRPSASVPSRGRPARGSARRSGRRRTLTMSASSPPASSSSIAMLAIARSAWASTSPIPTRLAGVQILADLAAQVDGVAGDDGLAEIVVEVLLGVGVPRVERPDPGVLHAAPPTWSASTRSDSPAERCTNSSGPSKSNVAVDRGQVGERRRLGEQLEGQPVAGVVGVQQVAGEGQQPAAVLRLPALVDGVELLHPRPGLGAGEGGRVGRHADLAADTARARCASSPAAACRRARGRCSSSDWLGISRPPGDCCSAARSRPSGAR